MNMMDCTCCITGHRNVPEDQLNYVREEIEKGVLQAIKDGYTHFISGFAEGADLMFAGIVAERKKENRFLSLEAAIPYQRRLKSKDQTFQALLAICDEVTVVCDEYTTECFFLRNRYLVDKSNRVLAVYDGRQKGGTFYTIQYAQKQHKEIEMITVKEEGR